MGKDERLNSKSQTMPFSLQFATHTEGEPVGQPEGARWLRINLLK